MTDHYIQTGIRVLSEMVEEYLSTVGLDPDGTDLRALAKTPVEKTNYEVLFLLGTDYLSLEKLADETMREANAADFRRAFKHRAYAVLYPPPNRGGTRH